MEGNDFADVVGAVADIMGKVPNAKVKTAGKVVKKAAPAIGAVAGVAPAVAKAAAPAAKRAGHAVAGAAVGAKDKVVGVAGAGKDKVAGKINDAVEKHNAKVSQIDARKKVLSYASTFVDASQLQGRVRDAGDPVASSFLDYSGCYAAITYGKTIRDVSQFREAHVSYADNMQEAIRRDLAGEGNADVYADAKYNQNVRFYLFPCSEEDSRELLPALRDSLETDGTPPEA